jgi:hypothetical protein
LCCHHGWVHAIKVFVCTIVKFLIEFGDFAVENLGETTLDRALEEFLDFDLGILMVGVWGALYLLWKSMLEKEKEEMDRDQIGEMPEAAVFSLKKFARTRPRTTSRVR